MTKAVHPTDDEMTRRLGIIADRAIAVRNDVDWLIKKVEQLRNSVRPDVTCGRCTQRYLNKEAVSEAEVERLRAIEAAAIRACQVGFGYEQDEEQEAAMAELTRLLP